MVRRLTKHGNSLALVIDKGIVDLLRVDASTPLSITTNGKHLVMTPVRDAQRERRFRAALEATNKKFGKALQRLAE